MRNRLIVNAAIFAMAAIWCNCAAASTLKTLFSFGTQGLMGDQAQAGLVSDSAGNLYGVTPRGGAGGKGVVFELIPSGDRSEWTYTVVHEFCTTAKRRCKFGATPVGRLIVDVNGNLYGVTRDGGKNDNGGTVYELMPDAGHTTWTFVLIHSFCYYLSCRIGGTSPNAGLTYAGAASGIPYDGAGPLYGATPFGGAAFAGTAFKLNRVAGHWKETVLRNFGVEYQDGSSPESELLMDQAGDLYGTTISGGSGPGSNFGGGTVFKLKHGNWAETILYNFCAPGAHCGDGSYPASGLSMDSLGNLYGTTTGGGANCAPSSYGCGVAFRLSHSGGSWHETVLYTFCQLTDCHDGAVPVSGLTMDENGNLYGTTYYGGDDLSGEQWGGGTIFKLSASSFQTLYSFCALTNCKDGDNPGNSTTGGGDLLIDPTGHLFGTTWRGGQYTQGVVFELAP